MEKTSDYIRKNFKNYFINKSHKVYEPSPLIPSESDTTMFTIAGMKQFTDIFTGAQPRIVPRAVTIQPCLRVGGKHNDLDMVGKTTRHNTFFEMMGNFSFYDYFKEEAIYYAYDFLINTLNLPLEYLYFTVHPSDEESLIIWEKLVGKRVIKLKENFWRAGDYGPCGPCTEIYFDCGKKERSLDFVRNNIERDPTFLEIWNVVFMSYEQKENGLIPMEKKSVDTGAGLERLCSVIDGTYDNFKTDLLSPIVEKVHSDNNLHRRIVADHMKSIVFLLEEKLYPSNEKRGYVLRKLIRRIGNMCDNILPLVDTVIETMNAYKFNNIDFIKNTLSNELEDFYINVEKGRKLLEKENNIDENTIFNLYQTHGFPMDIAISIVGDDKINENKLTELIEQHKADSKKKIDVAYDTATEILFYDHFEIESEIVHIEKSEDNLLVVTKASCFYVRGGGQEGDQGIIYGKNFKLKVIDTVKKPITQSEFIIIHICNLESGQVNIGDSANLIVNKELRAGRTRSHSATHLISESFIRKYKCDQAGSLVDDDYFRFDLYHEGSVKDKLKEIIEYANFAVIKNIKTTITYEKIENVTDALLMEGKNYGSVVRVVQMGEYSKQLCGGTHVQYTGDIGFIVLISEKSIKKGVRRVEGLCGYKAVEYIINLQNNRENNKDNNNLINEKTHIINKPNIQEYSGYIIANSKLFNRNIAIKLFNELIVKNKDIYIIWDEDNSTKLIMNNKINSEKLKIHFQLVGGGKNMIIMGYKNLLDHEVIIEYIKSF